SADFSTRPLSLAPSKGGRVAAQAVIIATGRARVGPQDLPAGERYYCRGVSTDALNDGPLPRVRDRPVVVVGQADCAWEDALSLVRFAAKVYVVCPDRGARRHRVARSAAEAILRHPRIEPRPGSSIRDVLGDDAAGVTGVRLCDACGVACDEVACAGLFLAPDCVRPNTGPFQDQLDLDDRGYVSRGRPDRSHTSAGCS